MIKNDEIKIDKSIDLLLDILLDLIKNSKNNTELVLKYKTTLHCIYQKFEVIDKDNKFLNKIFGKIFECLQLDRYKYDEKSCMVLKKIYEDNIDKLSLYFDLILLVTSVSNDYQIKYLKNLKICLNLIAIIEKNSDDQFKCQPIFNVIKKYVKIHYKITYNYDLIIKHKLFGYKDYIFDKLLNDSINEINFCQLHLLKVVQNDLIEENSINLILKLLENCKENLIESELRKLFWLLFDKFPFNQKKILAYNFYNQKIFKFNKYGGISCLLDMKFKNDLIFTVNQISASSFDDQEVKL
jgi:hypothetical protein